MDSFRTQDDLDNDALARLVIDFIHRIVVHHTLWFMEVEHQLGREAAFEIMDTAFRRSYGIQMNRLAQTLGFDMKDDVPDVLASLPREKLVALKDALAKNWLANDGVWFQAVEFSRNIFHAKRCNDSCWGRFSPFEAWSIKRFLGLPKHPGLDGLKQALQFRLYATLNKQSIIDDSEHSFIFQMNECRVQAARKRKNLPDYPCKSAGVVEFPFFASAIDDRIQTECIACPPDEHPEGWYCAWRFILPDEPATSSGGE